MLLAVACAAPLFYKQMYSEFDNDSFSWVFVVVLLGFVIGSVLLVLMLQYKNPASEEKWLRPGWYTNPFAPRQPVQTFHTAGWVFVALGISVAAYTLVIGSGNLLFVLPLTIGVGLIVAVKLSVSLFRTRFA